MDRQTRRFRTLRGVLVVLLTTLGTFMLSSFRNVSGIVLGFVLLYTAFFISAAFQPHTTPSRRRSEYHW